MAYVGPLSLSGSVSGTPAGYLPFRMGGATPDETRSAESRLSTAFPGISGFTEYTGRGADPVTSGLGLRFNNDVPDLFSGQSGNSVDAILANMPKVVEGAGKVSPETVTAATVGTSAPSGGVLQAGVSGPATSAGGMVAPQQTATPPLMSGGPNAGSSGPNGPSGGPSGVGSDGGVGPGVAGPAGPSADAGPAGVGVGGQGGPGTGGGGGEAAAGPGPSADAGPGPGADSGPGSGPGDGGAGDGGYHAGGDIKGEFGAEKTATVQSGEFVVNKYAAQKYKHLLEVLNRDGQREAAKRGDKASTSPQAAQASKKHAGGRIYDAGGMVDEQGVQNFAGDESPVSAENLKNQNKDDGSATRATAARVANTPTGGAPMPGTGDNPYMSAENPGQAANQKKIAGYAGQGGKSSGGGASMDSIIGVLGILA